jgi:hypothetical protein
MGLINLKTDLKSLKFGKDRLDGGSSNQPYITTPIPEGTSTLNNYDSDFLLRGGIRAVSDSATDVLRISKYFFDTKSPSGLLFTSKQNLLSRTAVRTQSSTTTLNEGVYSPTNTLAQVGVSAFGLHFYKQGTNPNEIITYSDIVKNNQDPNQNRLITISKSDNPINILHYPGGPGSDLGIGNTFIKYADQRTGNNNPLSLTNPTFFYNGYQRSIDESNNQVGGLQIDPEKPWIKSLSYELPNFSVNSPQSGSLSLIKSDSTTWTSQQNITGPNGSNYNWYNSSGSSKTYINLTGKSFDISSYWNIEEGKPLWQNNVYTQGNTFPENGSLIYNNNTFTYTQQDLIDQEDNIGKANGSPKTQDFRAILRNKLQGIQRETALSSSATPLSPDYTTKNIETRVYLGDPGKKQGKNLSSYTKGSGMGPVDKINALPVYQSQQVDGNKTINDLVKFRIAVIDNENPSLKTFIHFRAFLDSFSDEYSSEWISHKFLGRGENFYTYDSFNRSVSLSWTVFAQSKEELIPMYKKLNYLASSLAPDYSGNGFMKGNLIQLTVGGYLYEQVGWFGGITYDLLNDAPWEIGINDAGESDSSVKELPHMIKVTGFKFTPIHDFIPSINQRFIALASGKGSANNNYDR